MNTQELKDRIVEGNGELKPILEAVLQRYDGQMAMARLSLLLTNHLMGGNIFAQGAVAASDLPPAAPVERLWGFGLYPASVSLMIGETGAGKSALIYNLLLNAALGTPIWGIPFEMSRPLKIFYIDPENFGRTCALRLQRILGDDPRPSNLIFHPGVNIDLSQSAQVMALTEYIIDQQFDLVVLDPIAGLFATINENDNSEAQRQMDNLRRISRSTGAAVLAVHHTGKDATNSPYGRGATARLAAADVAFVLRCRGIGEEVTDDTYRGSTASRIDLVRIQIAKNRIEGRGSVYLQMAGEDKFFPSSFAAWREAGMKSVDEGRVSACCEDLAVLMADGNWRTRAAIFSDLSAEGYGQVSCDGALKTLMENGTLSKQVISGTPRYINSHYLGSEGTGYLPNLTQENDDNATWG